MPPVPETQEEGTMTIALQSVSPGPANRDVPGGYDVLSHSSHPRLKRIEIAPTLLASFLAEVSSIDVQNLEYVPFMRFILADRLEQAVPGLRRAVCGILADRAHGGLVLSV